MSDITLPRVSLQEALGKLEEVTPWVTGARLSARQEEAFQALLKMAWRALHAEVDAGRRPDSERQRLFEIEQTPFRRAWEYETPGPKAASPP